MYLLQYTTCQVNGFYIHERMEKIKTNDLVHLISYNKIYCRLHSREARDIIISLLYLEISLYDWYIEHSNLYYYSIRLVSYIYIHADRFIRIIIVDHIDIKHMTHNFSRSTMQCGVINLLIIRSQLEQMNFETPMS